VTKRLYQPFSIYVLDEAKIAALSSPSESIAGAFLLFASRLYPRILLCGDGCDVVGDGGGGGGGAIAAVCACGSLSTGDEGGDADGRAMGAKEAAGVK